MSAPASLRSPKPRTKIRRDGWTAERQLRFLDTLSRTRSVTKASAAAGMSRESAYRLRDRREGAPFAAFWDRAIAFQPHPAEVHIDGLSNGRLMRLLGTHFRRKRGDFAAIGSRGRQSARNLIGCELCDLMEPAPCPSAPAASRENRACSAGRG